MLAAKIGFYRSSFTPKNVANLAAWYDASVATSITTDGNGNVSAWADQSGNGRNLTQSAANNRPAYNTNVINGKPVVNFDGVNDAMLASFTLPQPVHYFLVWRYDSAYSSGNPRVFDGASGNSMGFFRTSSTQMALTAGSQNLAANISDAQGRAFSVVDIQGNGSSSAISLNGSNVNANTANIGTGSPNGIYLGVFGNGFSAPGDVSFAEFMVYSRILTATEAGNVRRYLGAKYGITVA